MEAWMNQSWWLYDATVLAILILCIWNGWRHGVIGTITRLVCYGIALLLAGALAQPAAEYGYDRWLADSCASIVSQRLEQYQLGDTLQQTLSGYGIQLDEAVLSDIASSSDGAAQRLYAEAAAETGIPAAVLEESVSQTVDQAADQMYGDLPDWMSDALLDSDSTEEMADRTAQTAALLLSGDADSAAEVLTQQYLRPVVLGLVKSFTFSVLFLLISLLLQSIIKVFFLVRPVQLRRTDQWVGVTVGCVQSIFLLVLMGKLTAWLVTQGAGQIGFFNEAVIAKTTLFQSLFRICK